LRRIFKIVAIASVKNIASNKISIRKIIKILSSNINFNLVNFYTKPCLF
jgi:hypothetical protein